MKVFAGLEEVNLLFWPLSVLCFLVCLPAVWSRSCSGATARLSIIPQVSAAARLSTPVSCIMSRLTGFSGFPPPRSPPSPFVIPSDSRSRRLVRGTKKKHRDIWSAIVSAIYMTAGVPNKLNGEQADKLINVTQEREVNLSVIIQFHGAKFV